MENEPRQFTSKRNFILQQGFGDPPVESCSAQFSALQFQPRIVGSLVLLGIVLQAPSVFLVLSAILWWSALLPQWNPFDILHNHTLGARLGAVQLKPAPAPRKFAQGMAGTFALLIGGLLLAQWNLAAFLLEAFFLAAVAALVFGHFCFGSFVYHLLQGRASFAKRTLPWVQNAQCVENSCSWR